MSVLFLTLIYYRTGLVVHLLLLKFSMGQWIWLSSTTSRYCSHTFLHKPKTSLSLKYELREPDVEAEKRQDVHPIPADDGAGSFYLVVVVEI